MIHIKQQESATLAADIDKWVANGGVIKKVVNKPIQVKHGTSDQYKKASYRCKKCVDWALKNGVVKTAEVRLKA